MRRARLSVPILCISIACSAGPVGCEACADDAAVAELALAVGQVERDFVGRQEQWSGAALGSRWVVGEGLRTGQGSSAELRLLPEGGLRVQSSTVVRFQDKAPGAVEPRLQLETGSVELEAKAVALEVSTPAGLARIERGSRVAVMRGGEKLRFDVRVGRVEVEGIGAVATAGNGFELDVGTLVVERFEQSGSPRSQAPDAAIASVESTADAGPPVAEPARTTFDPAPDSAHFTMPSGESAVIHDPGPPTHVRIDLAACGSEGGAVEVARAGGAFDHLRVRGQRSAILRLDRGSYRYRVRCFERGVLTPAVAHGRVTVRRDAGTRRLPRTPPAIDVDVDGRRYTVRYQNLLPRLSIRWPNAPSAQRYTLEIGTPTGKRLERESARPVVTLQAGVLSEGVHELLFRGAAHSVTGTLRIAFDNTARTAYLSSPAQGAVKAGEKIRLSGAALQGSSVSVAGRRIALTGEGRFATEVQVPQGGAALSVRVEHASTGVHYYLRRVALP